MVLDLCALCYLQTAKIIVKIAAGSHTLSNSKVPDKKTATTGSLLWDVGREFYGISEPSLLILTDWDNELVLGLEKIAAKFLDELTIPTKVQT
ncbi:hypothetical protein J6590_055179 [Homalodisca vitripennis]|nr:hypothetical protein J6590_055179 [Homalodisca vitripennis]